MNHKLNLTTNTKATNNFFNLSESESNQPNPIMRWIGISDLVEGGKFYQKKEYEPALKCIGIGLTKLGILTASIYGTYRWVAGNVVHLNEFITEAEEIFQKRSNESFAPNATDRLIDSLYSEQRTFKMWPKSGRDFFLRHLDLDYPMSAAIIEKLLKKAAESSDSTFNKIAIKECASATESTLSCIQVAKTLTQDSNQDNLSTAMSILTKCKKHTNAFCNTAMMNGMQQSIEKKQLSDVSTIAGKLLKGNFDVDQSKLKQFANDAATLFFQDIENKQQKVDDCKIAANKHAKKGSPEWDRCYAHANYWDRFEEIDRPWRFEERFLARKPGELESELKNDLSNGEDIALLYSSTQGSSHFAIQLFNSLIDANMNDEAVQLLVKNPADLQSMIHPMLNRLKNADRWDAAIQMILNISKKHPNVNINDQIQIFAQDLLKSPKSHLVFILLNVQGAFNLFDIRTILQKAFENNEEDHLHKVYLLAKSWIAKKDPGYGRHLEFLIDQMFATKSSKSSWYYNDPFNETMAKALVTKWVLANDPDRWNRLDLSSDWDLNKRDGSKWDLYYPKITQANWKKLAGIGS